MENIHEKIRLLRKKRGYTLKDMSEKTELSIGFLSQVERGSSSLAITSLKKIADALEVEMTYFFQKNDFAKYIVKKDDHVPFQLNGSGYRYTKLSGNFSGKALDAIKVEIQPLEEDSFSFGHPGEEIHFVIKGALEVTIDGETFEVGEGETIHYPSTVSHKWKNPLNEVTTVYSVLTPSVFNAH